MNSKRILMLCTNHWTSCYQVGSQHIARQFCRRDWQVAYVSSPLTLLNLGRFWTRSLQERLDLFLAGGTTDCDGNLWAYVPGTPCMPDQFPSRWLLQKWPSFTLPPFASHLAQCGFGQVDVLYIDNVQMVSLRDRIPHQVCIYRISDNQAGFLDHHPIFAEAEQELIHTADGVIYSASALQTTLETQRKNDLLFIPNGVDWKRFSSSGLSCPQELVPIPSPRAIYVGAMQYWFDYDLINEAAQRLPHVSFVLIGPAEYAKKRLKPLANIFLLGPQNYSAIPAFLYHGDVGLIPFNTAQYPDLVHAVNPLKLYEYFAAGLPVVATEWKEIRRLQSPAYVCGNTELFIASIEQALASPPQSETYRRYARAQDWSIVIEPLFQWLEEKEQGLMKSGFHCQ